MACDYVTVQLLTDKEVIEATMGLSADASRMLIQSISAQRHVLDASLSLLSSLGKGHLSHEPGQVEIASV